MRWVKFNVVGVMGFVVQLAALWFLRDGIGIHYLLSAAIATEVAVLHNFVWHVRWTWADRPGARGDLARRLVRFNLANGAISLAGNLVLLALLVELAGMPYLLASASSVAGCSVANFVVCRTVVFGSNPGTCELELRP